MVGSSLCVHVEVNSVLCAHGGKHICVCAIHKKKNSPNQLLMNTPL